MYTPTSDIKKTLPDLQAWRQDLHAHPELAYQETRTSGFVADTLRSWGLDVTTAIAKTGVVGVLDFGPGPSLGIRADMDALPLQEQTRLPFASKTEGIMHACGHDGHTVMALGAARILSEHRALKGKVVFIFQPAEENEGGADLMVREGLFGRFPMDAVFGLHNMPQVPIGEVWARPGAVSASFDTFDITLTGKGGHGAFPDQAADPVVAASQLVCALNTIVGRTIPAAQRAVIAICAVHAGDTYNVIPSQATIKGSVRAFDGDVQKALKSEILQTTQGMAAAFGIDSAIDYRERYPAVINTPDETQLLQSIVQENPSEFTLQSDFEPFMGSEDFSFYLQERPGCFFVIGNGGQGGPLHSPTYEFNDDALPVGVALWELLAMRFNAC
ncbi:MAG: M20 aminoacylase family protein [Pseudomonadota bacterium]